MPKPGEQGSLQNRSPGDLTKVLLNAYTEGRSYQSWVPLGNKTYVEVQEKKTQLQRKLGGGRSIFKREKLGS